MAATFLESLSIAYPRHGLLSAPTARPGALPLTHLPRGLKASSRLQKISLSARSAATSRPVRRTIVVCNGQQQDTAFSVPDVTKSAWKSTVLDSDVPVLVEFWASWCGPCRMIEPVIGKLSKDYSGKLKCYKLNTDENPDIATQYGIRSIPTMIIFKNGEKKELIIGAVPESTLVSAIEKFIER